MSTPVPANLSQAGQAVGSYRIVSPLGRGGMGEVWLAEHALLGRRAAIKLLRPELGASPDALTRFFNEARAAATISDPGIVQVYDFGKSEQGAPYLVMELLEGEALDSRLIRLGRIEVLAALQTIRQVAGSVGSAHACNIVHRDLKPENVFLIKDPEVAGGERAKILDFGIAKLTDDPLGSSSNTTSILGTPMFMSPEQCRGGQDVDQRSDVYAIGCLLFTLIAGRAPFEGSPGDIMVKHICEEHPKLSSLVAGVHPAVDDLVARCLAKQAEDRYRNGSELAAAVGQVIETVMKAPFVPTMEAPAPALHRTILGVAQFLPPQVTPVNVTPADVTPGHVASGTPSTAGEISVQVWVPSPASGTPGIANAASEMPPPVNVTPEMQAPASVTPTPEPLASGTLMFETPSPVRTPSPGNLPAIDAAMVGGSGATPPPASTLAGLPLSTLAQSATPPGLMHGSVPSHEMPLATSAGSAGTPIAPGFVPTAGISGRPSSGTTLSQLVIAMPSPPPSARRAHLVAIVVAMVAILGIGTWLALSQGAEQTAATGPEAAPERNAAAPMPDPGRATPDPALVPEPPPAAQPATAVVATDTRPDAAKNQLAQVLAGFAAWAKQNPGAGCPTLDQLARHVQGGVVDPWGQALILTCSDQPGDHMVGLISTGPDGQRGTGDDLASWNLSPAQTEVVRGPRWASTRSTEPGDVTDDKKNKDLVKGKGTGSQKRPGGITRDRFDGTDLGADGIPTER